MKVTLNNFALNDASNYTYLDSITGLDIPPIRTSSGNSSGQSGGYIGPQLYGMRPITLPGRIFSADKVVHETRRKQLQAALSTGDVEMRVTTDGGNCYIIYCKLIDFDMPISRIVDKSSFNIELMAPDAVIYDDSISGLNKTPLHRFVSGGLTWPLSWPLVWAPGSQPTIINNTGTVVLFPVITLTGSMSSPTITNQTTGQSFTMPGFTTGPTDVVVIDMRAHTVLLNGENVLGLTAEKPAIALITGNNQLFLRTSSGSDTVVGEVSWKPGVMGI
ncbi:phage tail domain-containing protein [Rhodococcus sp. YH3-3]|uniref:phage distal tail protein n=1 Tax=Rhodococcus sp. YH3-3 TaxID=1803579 RepID=UPI0007DB602C|nr:phage tail domain-containing protein [Rhodococcus sp. YH3-3]